MSLAAVPVYLWGRSLMAKRWALIAAALTLALPGLAYSGLVMSEVAFYPIVVLAAWAAARTLESPTLDRQAVMVLVSVLAVATRLQAVVLVPIFATALPLEAVIARRRVRLSAFVPTFAAAGVVGALWIGWRLSAHGSLLGGYGDVAGRYGLGRAAHFVGYHAVDVGLLAGIFPLCALLVLLWRGLRQGETNAQVRAYLAVSTGAVLWFVIEVGVFASREVGLLAERDLIALAPLLFIALALWLDRGLPGGHWLRALVSLGVAGGVVALPLGTLVTPDALPSAFSLIPLEHLRRLTSLHTTELVLALAVAAAAALFAFLPRQLGALLPVILLLALSAGSVSASREVAAQARAQKLRLLGPVRRWIDDHADGPVAYVYDGQVWWNAPWENVFWNRRVQWVYDLPGNRACQLHVRRRGSGHGGAVRDGPAGARSLEDRAAASSLDDHDRPPAERGRRSCCRSERLRLPLGHVRPRHARQATAVGSRRPRRPARAAGFVLVGDDVACAAHDQSKRSRRQQNLPAVRASERAARHDAVRIQPQLRRC
jgi:hypothetical protein